MKIEIHSNDNGGGTNSLLTVYGDYNPQNKVFGKRLCTIEEENFIECFEGKEDKVFEQIQKGKIVFDISKEKLTDKSKKWFN